MPTIQGVFGWQVDNPALVAGLRQSEAIVTRNAGSMQSKVLDIFKRSPHMRAERALSGLFESLASGNIAGGIQSISSRMTGLGLIAGVAIGAGVAIFAKFREQIIASREAHEALEHEITSHPLTIVTKLSDEGMAQALQKRQQLVADAAKKGGKTLGSELLEAGRSTLPFFFGHEQGEKRMEDVKAETAALEEGKQIMIARANLAMELTNIESARLSGHEREANVAKILLDTEQKRNALASSGVTKKAFDIGDEALSRNAEIMIDAENKRAAGKERNLALEEKMANLIKGGLKPEEQKKVRANLELQSIEAQLNTETNPETRRNLLLQKTQKQNELRGFAKPEEGENPFQLGTISAREFERSQESMKFNSQFASFGLTQQQQDLKAKPENQNQAVVDAVNKVTEAIKGFAQEINK